MIEYVVQVESRTVDNDWVDMYTGSDEQQGNELYLDAVKDYGATYKVQLVKRVITDTSIRRNYL